MGAPCLPSPGTLVTPLLPPTRRLRPISPGPGRWRQAVFQDEPTEAPEPQAPAPQHLPPTPLGCGALLGHPTWARLPPCLLPVSLCLRRPGTGHRLGCPPHAPRSHHRPQLFHLFPPPPVPSPLDLSSSSGNSQLCAAGGLGPRHHRCPPFTRHFPPRAALPPRSCACPRPLGAAWTPAPEPALLGLCSGRVPGLASAFHSPPASSPAWLHPPPV